MEPKPSLDEELGHHCVLCYEMLPWVASQVTARGKRCLIPQFSSNSSMPTFLFMYLWQQKGDISCTHRSSRIPWSRSLPSTCSTQSFTSASIGLVNATSTTTSLFTFASPSTCAKKMLVRPGSQCSFLSEPFQASQEEILWEAVMNRGRMWAEFFFQGRKCSQRIHFPFPLPLQL